VLISAFAKLREDNPSAVLVIAGDGPERKRLEEQAKSLGDSVRFIGYVSHDQVPSFMNMADIFVRVSLEEGLGIVFTEAMACKTPVVGTSVGGIPDIVEDGVTGILVPPLDVNKTARAISTLLKDDKMCARMSEKGYATIKSEYSWDTIYKKMLKVYTDISK
jgi:glycosyltransferase involved in cell wall biosynthesis